MKPITLSQHMSAAAKARHAKKTPEERSAYARMMVQKREEKREARRIELLAIAEKQRMFDTSDIRIGTE